MLGGQTAPENIIRVCHQLYAESLQVSMQLTRRQIESLSRLKAEGIQR